MWEIIAANKRKSLILFFGLGTCLLTLGYLAGAAYGGTRAGGLTGVGLAGILWIGWSLVSYYSGDTIILSVSGAREVGRDEYPALYNVVEEMKIAAGLAAMPRVCVIDAAAPNAFAAGRGPESSVVVVTAGLLAALKRDELQGVVAHEMSHIINRDVLFMTFAGVLLGCVQLVADVFLRSAPLADDNDNSSRPSGARAVFFAVAVVFAILAPILSTVLYYAISRQREYLADASAARLTRYPEGLAAALEKIAAGAAAGLPANKITAPMYIAHPLKAGEKATAGWTDTHPPIGERIRILRAMAGGAGLADYQAAYGLVKNGQALNLKVAGDRIIPPPGGKTMDNNRP